MVAYEKPLQVLVVDDDASVVRAVGHVITGLGHRPLPAGDRDEALAVVRARPVHLSILDVNVNADDGLKILLALRTIAERLPAIFMSGDLNPGVVARATTMGVDRLLEKPLDVGQLRRAIQSLIEVEKL